MSQRCSSIRQVACAALAVAIGATCAPAAVISVDLYTSGTASPGIPAGDFAGTFTTGTTTAWNTLTIGTASPSFQSNLSTPLTSGPLATMDGSAANAITFTLGAAGQTLNIATFGTSVPTALHKDYAFIRADGSGGYGPQSTLSFSFNGLVPGNSYDIKYFTPGNSASVTVGGSGPTTVAVNSVGTFTGLIANGSGVISGSFTQASGQNDAGMAGIQIQGVFIVPEPSTLILLATGLLGVLCYAKGSRPTLTAQASPG